MTELTAKNLKEALWETLRAVQHEGLAPAKADAVASQAREIIRTANLQLRIAQQSSRDIPIDVITFSEK